MSFYGTATGNPELAFMPEFSIIPNGTTSLARIKKFEIVSKENQYTGMQKFMQITWEICSDQFKGQHVTQKIKVFDGKPAQIERNQEMLMLVMKLCNFHPAHDNEPTNQELMAMNGKICGIKIREWSMPKQDGSGMMEGNFVGEVHPAAGFELVTGVKEEHVHSRPTDSALNRNASSKTDSLGDDSDIPF
jgi:hypothetical protein